LNPSQSTGFAGGLARIHQRKILANDMKNRIKVIFLSINDHRYHRWSLIMARYFNPA